LLYDVHMGVNGPQDEIDRNNPEYGRLLANRIRKYHAHEETDPFEVEDPVSRIQRVMRSIGLEIPERSDVIENISPQD